VDRLSGQLDAGCLPVGVLPERLKLTGFIELTKQERRLLDRLQRAGVVIETGGGDLVEARTCYRQCYGSTAEELTAAARWASRRLEDGKQRVGIIVNGLDALYPQVHRIFGAEFQPGDYAALKEGNGAPYRVSTGRTLKEEPVIRDALLLLKLSLDSRHKRHGFHRISAFLLSQNWAASNQERHARALLEYRLRQMGYYNWSLGHLAEQASRHSGDRNLGVLIRLINELPGPAASAHPSQQLVNILNHWQWPGPADEQTINLCRRLVAALERFSQLDMHDARECLDELTRWCGRERIAGPGGAFSPVQIMTPEEAYGLTFDAVRVLNVTLENWPGQPLINPLVPREIVRQIPRAGDSGLLDYAEKLTRGLKRCADEVVFSWCNRLDDLPVSASPLISDLPEQQSDLQPEFTLWQALTPRAAEISTLAQHPWLHAKRDRVAISMNCASPAPLRGAVSFLNLQSACPLAAYLAHRMNARWEDFPTRFTDAAFQGLLVHSALDHLYRPGTDATPEIGDVTGAVHEALTETYAERRLLPAEYAAVSNGLERLLREWLEFEGQWQGRTVEATEWKGQAGFGGFLFDVRIDRIDRMASGGQLLIDYKTGRSNRSRLWSSDRLAEVQLPLYCILLSRDGDHRPAGVALAHVRPDEMKFTGLSDEPLVCRPGISGFTSRPSKLAKELGSWTQALATWENRLRELLGEIEAGDCRHVLFHPDGLQYAGLELLMRTREAQAWVEARGGCNDS
jgi:probable DNA repair protein